MSTILTIRHLSGSLAGKSQRVALREGQALRLGRAAESDIKFSDAADDSVSGVHAELSLEGGRLQIEDKRSANGTFVNGAPCPPFQKVAVPDGSRIRLAKAGPEMQVVVEPAPAAAGAEGPGATVPPPKEGVGRATLLREIDQARQEERKVVAGEVAKARKSSGLWGAGLLVLLLLAAAAVGGAMWWNQRRVQAQLAEQRAELEREKQVWAEVEKKVSPAVVRVRCVYSAWLAGDETPWRQMVEGSGVQIRPGLILTAQHVAEPWKWRIAGWADYVERYGAQARCDRLEIQFPGFQPLTAITLATAEHRDLALLQTQATVAPDVPIVGSNSQVKVTDRIAVIGYPANLGQRPEQHLNLSGFGADWTTITEITPTFVAGTVSQPLTGAAGPNFVFFEAAVTHGNSGGPVVNDRGELVGIVSQKYGEDVVDDVGGLRIRFQKPVDAATMAVSPDDIQAFLASRGIR